ncbi:MAG: pectin acetylesterase-family hydrolase, partial [Myxococcota bacterium]
MATSAACGDDDGTDDMGMTTPADSGVVMDSGTEPADMGTPEDMGEADMGVADMGGGDMGTSPESAAIAMAAANPDTWVYVPVGGAKCRDGTDTGFVLRLQTGATDLVMYLQGGGACFNAATCSQNPSTFGETEAQLAPMALVEGIFDSTSMDNPVAGWNMAFIPYCSGDVFGGTAENVTVPGVAEPQQFVGANNMQLFSDLLAAELPNTTQVLLTGSSAGGYGANLNLERVITAFGTTPVHMLNDSGQPFDPGLSVTSDCLSQLFYDLWGFNAPAACTDCGATEAGFLGLSRYFATSYPMSKQAILSYTEDGVIRFFNAFGLNDCAGSATPVPGEDFRTEV